MSPEHASSPEPDPLEPGLRAAFRRPNQDRPSVLTRLGRRAGMAPKVTLRDTPADLGPLLDPSSPERHARPAGRTGYQLLGEIARGGMGVILRGHDQDLGRDVAMKVLHEKLANRPELVQRFVEEAQIGGQLQHPGIVPVYELGLMADQRPYFTMKLVKGRTLAALLAERTEVADRRKLLDVFEAVCQTMAYAHSRGVIHRDLKPANVMVGAFGEVQVVDWGLAKVLRRGGRGDEQQQPAAAISIIETVRSAPGSAGSQSVVGSVLGTPAYMPPEQARGDVEHLDERSDVFSLGAILCEILTGQPPYVGAEERTIVLAAQGKLEEAVTRIDACGADAELIALCRQCLLPAPLARPRSAEVLAEKLHGYLTSVEQRAQTARVEAAEAKVQAAAERKARRLTASLAAAVLAFMLLGGGGYWWLEQRELDRRRATEQAVTAALNDATLARGRADWPAAHAALERAEARLDAGNATPALREQVATGRHGIEREAAAAAQAEHLRLDNAALLAAFQDVRQPENQRYYTTDWARLDEQCRSIAHEHSIDVDAGEVPATAASLVSRGIAADLAAALDEWALICNRAGNASRGTRLSALASALDADPTRTGLRAALAAKDVEALGRLATDEAVATMPAATLRLLAQGLIEGKAMEQAAHVLAAGRLRFPRDFMLAMDLGRALWRDPQTAEEAAACYSAALALRPDSVEAWHELGRVLDQTLGQPARAAEFFQTACARWPQDAHLLWHLGKALATGGRLDEAFAALQRALALDPKDAAAHNSLGVVLVAQRRPDEAIASYHRAIALDPDYAPAHYNLGLALSKQGNLDLAIDCYRRALEIDPKLVQAHNNLGGALYRQHKLDEAIEHFHSALELDPNDALALTNLGAALADQQKLDEAIDCHRRALLIDPKLAAAHLNLGLALHAQGKTAAAIESWRRAVELAPDNAKAQYSLGFGLQDQGQLDQAIDCYRSAIALEPKNTTFLNDLGVALRDHKQFDEAIKCHQRAIELEPDVAMFHLNLGASLGDQGQYDLAIASYRRSLQLDPRDARARYNLGFVLAAQGHLDEAIDSYRRALDLEPRFAMAHMQLGNALSEHGQLDEAIACYGRAIEIDPKYAIARVNLGNALDKQGQHEEAITCYRRALEIDPKCAPAFSNLGVVLFSQGRSDDAIACYRRALEIEPDNAPVHADLGTALANQRDVGGAMASYRRAIELGLKDAPVFNDVAWWLATRPGFEPGDAQEAIRCAQHAVQQEPGQGAFWNTLGVAHYRAGQFEACAKVLQRSVELTGGNGSDWLFLAMAQHRLGKTDAAKDEYRRALDWWSRQTDVSEEQKRFRAEAEQVLGIVPESKHD